MCLGIPGEILEIDGHEARAKFWNVEKTVRLDIVGDTVEEGDYVLNHAGFAIRKIPDDDVEETIAIYESFLEGDEDEALEEIGATDAVLEFGERSAAVSESPTSVASDSDDRRRDSTTDEVPSEGHATNGTDSGRERSTPAQPSTEGTDAE